MKQTPLLDFWQKPRDAGEPVAMLATTYALEPDFFEQNCLARFVEVSSVDEGSGSVEDIVARVELHELLRNARVTVLVDRSAPVQRTSLLWDLLSCKVDGGLLHAKVTVLLWERATRVIVGSANLTSAGYRRQVELGLAADLGPQCLLPQTTLAAIADELESYLSIVPGYDSRAEVFVRASRTLDLFRERIALQPVDRTSVRVAFAPTNDTESPLERMSSAWSGPQPIRATHLSPFWDSDDRAALIAVRKLLTGRPADERSQRVAVVLGPRGQCAFPQRLAEYVDSVQQLQQQDTEIRLLHAKCLLIESREWVAALVGSSNHTKAGFGLVRHSRHREMNVWLGAPRDSDEGEALLDLVRLGKEVPADADVVEPQDEDQNDLPALPACFGLCRLARNADGTQWALHLGIVATSDMPAAWKVGLNDRDPPFLTRSEWEASGSPATTVVAMQQDMLPMYALVGWDGLAAPWAVVADDRHCLPAGPELSSLRAQQLLDALAKGLSVAQILREMLERHEANASPKGGIDLNPLKRLEVEQSLLRKGRALAASLSAMQRRLERPVLTVDALRGRLASPLGPEFVAIKVAEGFEAGLQTRAEAVFTIAEIALVVGRVNWSDALGQIDRAEGLVLVGEVLGRLDTLRSRVGEPSADLASYAVRAIKEARECLSI